MNDTARKGLVPLGAGSFPPGGSAAGWATRANNGGRPGRWALTCNKTCPLQGAAHGLWPVRRACAPAFFPCLAQKGRYVPLGCRNVEHLARAHPLAGAVGHAASGAAGRLPGPGSPRRRDCGGRSTRAADAAFGGGHPAAPDPEHAAVSAATGGHAAGARPSSARMRPLPGRGAVAQHHLREHRRAACGRRSAVQCPPAEGAGQCGQPPVFSADHHRPRLCRGQLPGGPRGPGGQRQLCLPGDPGGARRTWWAPPWPWCRWSGGACG